MVPEGWEREDNLKTFAVWERKIPEWTDAVGESFLVSWKDMSGRWRTRHYQWDLVQLEHIVLTSEQAAACADSTVKLPIILLSRCETHWSLLRVR